MSFLEVCIKNNFQNYEQCKDAYNRAFGVKFGDIGFPNIQLEKLRKFLRYRHRIIHQSSLMTILNQPESPPEELVFCKLSLAQE